MTPTRVLTLPLLVSLLASLPSRAAESMDRMWGDTAIQSGQSAERSALFDQGNYGMFMHWGLYSHLGGKWKDETFYGIGEWIKRQMKISDVEYKGVAAEFNPSEFDAGKIVSVAKEAGMKWIIITSKHHEGFAMFKSAHPFNIVDASPFGRDPMKELAAACREAGLGFGFYYSHFQDWTAPGASGGPGKNPDGSSASFEQYFREKCFPQVKEICTNYGPLSYVWFDTPGSMPKEFVVELADYVRKTQPQALLCSRIGHGMGDYASKGDMEVPVRRIEGLWETCDTTNDSWSYAWYDQNWKSPKEILHRLVSTVARGGTYLLNVGPDGKGNIPEPAARHLVQAGQWIKQNPSVIYQAGPSPWETALPWGDVTTGKDLLNLVVFDRPDNDIVYLPGLQNPITAVQLVVDGKTTPLHWEKKGSWTAIQLPPGPIAAPAFVVQVKLDGAPKVDAGTAVFPNMATQLPAEFAEAENAIKKRLSWMEKFGEWKFAVQVGEWKDNGTATWQVELAEPGAYEFEVICKGGGKIVWRIGTDEGVVLQNQQNSSDIYHPQPIGELTFKTPGKHTIAVSVVGGDGKRASLESIRLTPVR